MLLQELNEQKQPTTGIIKKICSKITGEHTCWSVISIKLFCTCVCSPVNLQHIFRTSFYENPSGWLLLNEISIISIDTNWIYICKHIYIYIYKCMGRVVLFFVKKYYSMSLINHIWIISIFCQYNLIKPQFSKW